MRPSGGLAVGSSHTRAEAHRVQQSAATSAREKTPCKCCRYPASPLSRATVPAHPPSPPFPPSHVPNPTPRDQCPGSVQDQVIGAPENCKAIPEQLSAFSGVIGAVSCATGRSGRGAKGEGAGTCGVYFCPAKKGKDCVSGKAFARLPVCACVCVFFFEGWESEKE